MHVQPHDRQQLSSLVVKEPYSSSQPLTNNIYNSQQQLIIKKQGQVKLNGLAKTEDDHQKTTNEPAVTR